MTYDFKEHVTIVELCMVKINVSILNRLINIGFFVNAKYIHKHDVIWNKTLTKLLTILTKCFFLCLNPTSCLKNGGITTLYTLRSYPKTCIRGHPHSMYVQKSSKLGPPPPLCTQWYVFALTPVYAYVFSIYLPPPSPFCVSL